MLIIGESISILFRHFSYFLSEKKNKDARRRKLSSKYQNVFRQICSTQNLVGIHNIVIFTYSYFITPLIFCIWKNNKSLSLIAKVEQSKDFMTFKLNKSSAQQLLHSGENGRKAPKINTNHFMKFLFFVIFNLELQYRRLCDSLRIVCLSSFLPFKSVYVFEDYYSGNLNIVSLHL